MASTGNKLDFGFGVFPHKKLRSGTPVCDAAPAASLLFARLSGDPADKVA
jgi:hypothetical protein